MVIIDEEGATSQEPLFGIIMLNTVFPRIPGDVGNPDTFSFPVRYEIVKEASSARVVEDTDPLLLQSFIDAGRVLECSGVKAIATSCGFLSIFHRELADAISVPVFSSSLLQVPLVHQIIKKGQKIGIITARRQSLTRRHLAGVGIESYPLAIIGMDEAEEFTAVFIKGKTTLDREKCRLEIIAIAEKLVVRYPDIGAIVLECTNMPPYAKDIQEVTGRPVFDVVTMINYGHAALKRQRFG
jgi:Asp/Glu/hydantoin racemase